jgi:maltose/moltooligosaccharide transporter
VQLLTGSLNGTYNIICFVVAFIGSVSAQDWAKGVHFVLLVGGIGLLSIPF